MPCPPPENKPRLAAALILSYRAREHAGAAEVALDAGDLAEWKRQRSVAALERRAAEEAKA